MPLPIEGQEWVQAQPPSPSSRARIRSRGEGQVFSVTFPAVAPPQSRRFGLPLRLFQHLALTRAFVEAVHPRIVNGSLSWPLRSRSAPAVSWAGEEGRTTTKTSPVSCKGGSWWYRLLIFKRKSCCRTVVRPLEIMLQERPRHSLINPWTMIDQFVY